MDATSPSWKLTPRNPWKPPEPSYSLLPTVRLVTPRRYDLAVKWRLFRSLLPGGSDPDAERIYRWHLEQRSGHRMRQGLATDLWKLTLHEYVASAEALLWNMQAFGFLGRGIIPVDADGEIFNGSHRVACALALGIGEIPVTTMPGCVWAPSWGYQWFVDHGMAGEDLERLRQDWAAMSSSCRAAKR